MRQALLATDGVVSATVIYEPPHAEVRYDAARTTTTAMMAAIGDTGFSASLIE